MSEILEKYQLSFINRSSDKRSKKYCYAPNLTDGTSISMLLNFINDIRECDSIIAEIDNAMSQENFVDSYPIDEISLEVSSTTSLINEVAKIPLEDLKAIILEWRKFLETPPFNNQEMD